MKSSKSIAACGCGDRVTGEIVLMVAETGSNGDNATRTERFTGKFRRTITLPTRVDANKVNASYKDGILTVTLPKAEEAKPKQIQVNVS